MVQVSKRSYDDSIEYCQVHDLLRELAIEKAKEIDFLIVCSKEDEEQNCCEARRVAVHYSHCDGLLKYANPSLRTFLYFNSPQPNCSGYKLLRVLSDMRKPYDHYDTDPNHIEGLTQLRYIHIHLNRTKSNVTRFLKLINNMKFLQTLHLYSIDDLSDFMWDIETLRHIMITYSELALGPPSGSCMRNLQTLTGVKTRESWETKTLPNLQNLCRLEIFITKGFSSKVVADFLHTLKSLVHLDLRFHYDNNIPLDVFDMRGFPFYRQLTSLVLSGNVYYGTGVTIDPAMFPTHLTSLIIYFRMHQDPMAVLEKLYNLKYLCLSSTIDEECIKAIRCSARGFPRLQCLGINSLDKVEEWEIEEGAMPMLQSLSINRCPKLRVPLGLQCLTTLRSLQWIFWSGEEPSAARKAEEIRNLCLHVPHIEIID